MPNRSFTITTNKELQMLKRKEDTVFINKDDGTPTILMGDYSILIGSVTEPKRNAHGVTMVHADNDQEPFLHILSTQPETLKIIIDRMNDSLTQFFPEIPHAKAQISIGDLSNYLQENTDYRDQMILLMANCCKKFGCDNLLSSNIAQLIVSMVFGVKPEPVDDKVDKNQH